MTTLANFPPEVLLKIFSHLGYRDLVCARRTCVQWRDLSLEEGLLRTIKNDVEEGVELDMNTLLTFEGEVSGRDRREVRRPTGHLGGDHGLERGEGY